MTGDAHPPHDGSIWRRAFHGQLPLWQVFWLVFVPAIVIPYSLHAKAVHAFTRWPSFVHFEIASIFLALITLTIIAAAGTATWRCAVNTKRAYRRQLARLLVIACIAFFGSQQVAWLASESSLFAQGAARIKAARDHAYCSSFHALAARSSSTPDRKKWHTDLAEIYSNESAILANTYFFMDEFRKAEQRISVELSRSTQLAQDVVRIAGFCSSATRENIPLIMQRIRERATPFPLRILR